ncbi:MAG: hypothetical protein JWM35_2009, partial [Verrucomicrobia bacterium]|nr:hypothetical protein [Verrucomicrobiota bacterium]
MSSTLDRKQTLTKRHRNLFNGDSCVFFYNPELWQPEDFSLRMEGKKPGPDRPGVQEASARDWWTGCTPVPVGGPFKAKAIHRYVDKLADNGIDTFLINANASRAWYPSKVIPTILDGYRRGDRDYFRGHAVCMGAKKPEEVERFIDRIMPFMNLYQDLLDAGVDWMAEAV